METTISGEVNWLRTYLTGPDGIVLNATLSITWHFSQMRYVSDWGQNTNK